MEGAFSDMKNAVCEMYEQSIRRSGVYDWIPGTHISKRGLSHTKSFKSFFDSVSLCLVKAEFHSFFICNVEIVATIMISNDVPLFEKKVHFAPKSYHNTGLRHQTFIATDNFQDPTTGNNEVLLAGSSGHSSIVLKQSNHTLKCDERVPGHEDQGGFLGEAL